MRYLALAVLAAGVAAPLFAYSQVLAPDDIPCRAGRQCGAQVQTVVEEQGGMTSYLSGEMRSKLATDDSVFGDVRLKPFKGDYDFDKAASLARPPTLLDVNSVYPAGAVRAGGVNGSATVRCHVSSAGIASRCTVVSESPRNVGFGDAGKALAARLALNPGAKDGAPAPSAIDVTVNFRGPGKPPNSILPYHLTFKDERIVATIQWLKAPSIDQVLAAYPEAARRRNLTGRALMRCVFGEDGGLVDCMVNDESPVGQQFGEAARRLAPHFGAVSTVQDGKSIKGVIVDIPVVFDAALLEKREAALPKWERTAAPSTHAIVIGRDPTAKAIDKAQVIVACAIGADGGLEACDLVSEEPAGYGFGNVALDAAAGYKSPKWSPDGTPMIGAKVRIPFDFVSSPNAQAAIR